MMKAHMKAMLLSLAPNQVLAVQTANEFCLVNYRVIQVRRGRGRGGSVLVDLESLWDGSIRTLGTPQSEQIRAIEIRPVYEMETRPSFEEMYC